MNLWFTPTDRPRTSARSAHMRVHAEGDTCNRSSSSHDIAVRLGLPIGGLCMIAVAALALLGCDHSETEAPPDPTPVKSARVERGTVIERTRLSGRVVPPADRDATLAPLVAGRLLVVAARAGDSVKKGQVLYRIDPASLEGALASALAAERRAASELDFRRKSADRTRGLFEKGVSSRQDAEADEAAAVAAETAHAEASSAVAEARRRRGWAEGVAPFDGVVVRVMLGAGEQVDGTPATAVLEVASPVPVEIAASATADVLARISVGQRVSVLLPGERGDGSPARATVESGTRELGSVAPAHGSDEARDPAHTNDQNRVADAKESKEPDKPGGAAHTAGSGPAATGATYSDAPAPAEGAAPSDTSAPGAGAAPPRASALAGLVTRAARAIDPATGIGEVRFVLDDPHTSLLLGASVVVDVPLTQKDGVLVVPATALRRTGAGRTEVVLVQDGKVAARAVRTGIVDGDMVEILSGIAVGDEVVIDDPNGLVDGTLVKPGS